MRHEELSKIKVELIYSVKHSVDVNNNMPLGQTVQINKLQVAIGDKMQILDFGDTHLDSGSLDL